MKRSLIAAMALSFCLVLWPMRSAHGEFRVFELEIVDGKGKVLRKVLSTLDHLQYPTYYQVNDQEYVRYGRSWMCWGHRTPGQPLCPAPENLSPTPNGEPTNNGPLRNLANEPETTR